MGARAVANDARRVGLAAVRQSRLARAANSQAMEALEPLHDELAMSPVGWCSWVMTVMLLVSS